jgi:hypothetical protein
MHQLVVIKIHSKSHQLIRSFIKAIYSTKIHSHLKMFNVSLHIASHKEGEFYYIQLKMDRLFIVIKHALTYVIDAY